MSLEAAYKYVQHKTGDAFVTAEEAQLPEVRQERLFDIRFLAEMLNNLTGLGLMPAEALSFESLGFSRSELRRLHDFYDEILSVADAEKRARE